MDSVAWEEQADISSWEGWNIELSEAQFTVVSHLLLFCHKTCEHDSPFRALAARWPGGGAQ